MKILKLDGLRGLFSLMVVLYHYPQNFMPNFIYNSFFIRESYAFVDFFFVLSGFVIALNYNHISTPSDLYQYLKKRFIRLYPLLFFSSSIFFVYLVFSRTVMVKFFPEFMDNPSSEYYQYIIPFFDVLLMTNSTKIFGTSMLINGPSWSISSEMISYAVFGVLFVFLNKKFRNLMFGIIIVFSCIILYFQGNFFSGEDYGFVRGLVGFFSGYFTWVLSKKQDKLSNLFEFLFPILIITLFYFLHLTSSGTSKIGLPISIILTPLVFSCIILFFTKTNGVFSLILELKPIQYLGQISYSLYLNHTIIILVVPKILNRIFQIRLSLSLELIITLVVLIIYSHITYKFIELKVGNYLKKSIN